MASDASIYVADTGNHTVRHITRDGTIVTVAGTGNAGYSGDGGPATTAQFRFPNGIALDHSDRLYIADAQNARLRRLDAQGNVTTVAGTGVYGFSGDGGPAGASQINYAPRVDVASVEPRRRTGRFRQCGISLRLRLQAERPGLHD